MLKKIIVMFGLSISVMLIADDCLQEGANRFQPAPVLTTATNVSGVITVSGTLSTIKRNATYLIQFFGNPTNRNPITEGSDYLGEICVTTNCLGIASFTATLPVTRIDDGFISATATAVLCDNTVADVSLLATCDGILSDTSMFSLNIPIA